MGYGAYERALREGISLHAEMHERFAGTADIQQREDMSMANTVRRESEGYVVSMDGVEAKYFPKSFERLTGITLEVGEKREVESVSMVLKEVPERKICIGSNPNDKNNVRLWLHGDGARKMVVKCCIPGKSKHFTWDLASFEFDDEGNLFLRRGTALGNCNGFSVEGVFNDLMTVKQNG